jgi:hypothetical protein
VTARDARTFRASLDARLMNRSRETGYDVNRLRRHVVFHRILARLAVREGWVLKGGFALEVRLAPRARATKDLDLALLEEGADVHDKLLDALADDPDGDGFAFETRRSGAIAPVIPRTTRGASRSRPGSPAGSSRRWSSMWSRALRRWLTQSGQSSYRRRCQLPASSRSGSPRST